MRNILIFSWILLLFTACETGTRYDTNTSKSNDESSDITEEINADELYDPTHSDSYYIDQGEDDYAEEIASLENEELSEIIPKDITEEEFIEENQIVTSYQNFEGGTVSDGLDIHRIRVANHDDYVRVVFDSSGADKVGHYKVSYNPESNLITVVIDGYRNFTGKFPSFSNSSIIEKMSFAKYLDDSGYKLYIHLKESTKIKAFALNSPARLVIDIQKP